MTRLPSEQIPFKDRQALQQSEEMFRLMVESVQDYAIFMLDVHGYVMSWNAGAQRIKGYSSAEIIGQHFSRFYTGDDIAKGKPAVELTIAAENGRVEDFGWRLRKDGSRFWANVTITALRDKTGELKGYAKVTRDMTERRLAEEVLRQSEERLRLMIESVKEYAIFMLDENGYITSWNVGAERIKGYKANEVIGKHFSIFRTEDDIKAGKPQKELEGAAEMGSYLDEGWRVRKDGSRFWSLVVLTAIRDHTGALKGFAKVTRDMTERRLMEEALENKVIERTAELRRINSELQQFAYVASHDLQEPLRMVSTYLDLLRYRIDGKLDKEEKEFLDYALQGAERSQQLIRDLLEYSHVGSGRREMKTIDLNAAARDAMDNIKLARDESGAEIQIESLPQIKADPLLMTQLFQNLFSNAIKYRSEVPPRIHVSAREEDECWCISVRDNGLGIEPQFHNKVFELFQRLHRRDEYSGTGLGLAICKKIVERHHGTIWVESETGKGSCFKFRVPK